MRAPLVAPHAWRHTMGQRMRTLRHAIDSASVRLRGRFRRVTREQVLWALMAIAFLLFALVLVLQPTAVGRGGR